MSGFTVLAGALSPFDDAHKGSRRAVVLREEGGMTDVAFCTSKSRNELGAWLAQTSPAFVGSGFAVATTVGHHLCRVPSDSVWLRGARVAGVLKPQRDNRFGEGFARMLAGAQIAVFEAKEAPLHVPMGQAPARYMEYRVIRFPL